MKYAVFYNIFINSNLSDLLSKHKKLVLTINQYNNSFEKVNDKSKKKNNEKKASIEEYIEKRRQETMGVKSDDKDNVFQKRKNLTEEIKKLTQQINNEEQSIAPIRKKFNLLNDKVKAFDKYHLKPNLKSVAGEIKKIQEKISFSAINVNEEQELLNRKSILEDYQKALKAFLDFKKENSVNLNKTKENSSPNIDFQKKISKFIYS